MSKKLCSLVKKGFCGDEPKEYSKLIKDPKYWCKKCGRAAADSSNLCKSKKL